MVKPSAGVSQASRDVLSLEIRKLTENLLWREPGSQEVEDVNDANPHAADAGAAPALLGVDGYSVSQVRHERSIVETPFCVQRGL